MGDEREEINKEYISKCDVHVKVILRKISNKCFVCKNMPKQRSLPCNDDSFGVRHFPQYICLSSSFSSVGGLFHEGLRRWTNL